MKSFIALLLCVLLPVLAFAADTEPTLVGTAVAGFFTQVIFPVLGAAAMSLVLMLLAAFRKKTGIQLSADTEAYLENLARQGIGRAEEHGADYIKRNVTKLTGNEKFDIAVAHVLTNTNVSISQEKADALVKSMLGQTKGVGAS